MDSVMTHNFSNIPEAEIQRSSFDRSFGHKTTFDAGYLVPVFWDEALPGDTFSCNATMFARLGSPLKYPIMDNLVLDSFFFAVPIRLVWTNFVRQMGERKPDPDSSTDFHVPTVTAPAVTGVQVGELNDYFGVPTGIASLVFDSLFMRAYNLIWNEWFRDQNIQDSVVVDLDDGPDTYSDYVLLRRGKRHDYFTSCLPWPQKATDVTLPLGTQAPLIGIGLREGKIGSAPTDYATHLTGETVGITQHGWAIDPAAAGGADAAAQLIIKQDNTTYPAMYADLSNASAATINAIRTAIQTQRLYERDARGGTRYCEIIQSHFGVTDPMSAVLQRPVYLGGGSTPVNVHPVAATNKSAGVVNVGDLASFGTVAATGHGFTKSFTEHSLIIGLVCVRADLTYQQGLNRAFKRQHRFDFYWPALSHLGEQTVLRGEIYTDGTSNDDIVFGYQERYAEYRYKPSMITGKFRSTYATPLDAWHLSQEFGAAPTLDSTFIVENPPMDRVLAVNTEPHFLFDSFFKLICARPMPTYSVPGMMDHF